MGSPFIVANPDVTWVNSPIADSKMIWQTATVTETRSTSDYLDDDIVNNRVPHLASWTGTLAGFLGTPINGAGLGVTYADGYADHIEGLSVNISCNAVGYYSSSGSNEWMSFNPGVLTWNASYNALVEDDEELAAVNAVSAASAATFQISSGNTLAGNVLSASVSEAIPKGDYQRVTVNVVGSGGLTVVGSNNILAAVDPVPRPTAGALTIVGKDQTTDVQGTGTAFWTSLAMNLTDAGMVNYSIGFQGSGAWTRQTPSV